jgi:drug/metabolite transporter (DMT)-like permease
MMLAVTVLTYQAVHWFMGLSDPSVAQSGLVSVCMGALTGCFGIWMGKEQVK